MILYLSMLVSIRNSPTGQWFRSATSDYRLQFRLRPDTNQVQSNLGTLHDEIRLSITAVRSQVLYPKESISLYLNPAWDIQTLEVMVYFQDTDYKNISERALERNCYSSLICLCSIDGLQSKRRRHWARHLCRSPRHPIFNLYSDRSGSGSIAREMQSRSQLRSAASIFLQKLSEHQQW